MTVKTTGFTIQDAFEAKTKRLRNKFANFVTPSREPSEALENFDSIQKIADEIQEIASKASTPAEDLLRIQKEYANADWSAVMYGKILKDLAVLNGQVTSVPRTRLGAEALRDLDIDLDTVNYAFDRAMKQSHG